MATYPKIGSEREHRVIWEQAHGPIPDGYIIHHRNGDITDNRLENLELMMRADHSRHHNKQETSEARFVRTRGWRGRKQPADMVAKRVASTKERWAKNGRKRPAYLDEDRCRRGHDLSVANNRYVRPNGRVNCRECKRFLERGVV